MADNFCKFFDKIQPPTTFIASKVHISQKKQAGRYTYALPENIFNYSTVLSFLEH